MPIKIDQELIQAPHQSVTSLFHEFYPLISKAITAAIIFIIFLALSWIIGRIFRHSVKNHDTAKIAKTLGRLIRNTILILGAVVALSSAGFNFSSIIAGIGLWALAIGYCMQYIFANIGAGFVLMLSGEVKKGDHVSVSGVEGVVLNISLRYTTLQNGANTLLIPNNVFLTYPITRFAK